MPEIADSPPRRLALIFVVIAALVFGTKAVARRGRSAPAPAPSPTPAPAPPPPPPAPAPAAVVVESGEPWDGYADQDAKSIATRLSDADGELVATVEVFERENKNRKTVLDAVARRLKHLAAE